MTTYIISGTFANALGGVNGAVVDAWKASRFSGVPALNASPPSGVADAGTVTTASSFGGPGAWQIIVPTNELYYVRIQYLSIAYWSLCSEVIGALEVGSSGSLIAPINMGSYQINFLATGTASTDAVNLGQVNSLIGIETTRAEAAEALLAPLANPALTGTPTAPTAGAHTNNTQIATTAYADAAVTAANAITRSVNIISTSGSLGAAAKTDYVYIVTASTTQTLPTAVGNTNRYTIKNRAGANVTLASVSAQTFDGGASPLTLTANQSQELFSDGSNWVLV